MTRFIVPLFLMVQPALLGQTTTPPLTPPGKLAFILPSLLDQALASIPPQAAAAIPALRESIQPRWVSLNSSVATQLSNLPNPSPASAIRYTWDPDSGTLLGTPQSLGPVLAERAETIGKNKFLFAITNQNFAFDRLDKLDLRGFEVVYPVTIPAGAFLPVAFPAIVLADAYININVNETTAHFTYGITHWLDASYAFPIITSSVTIRGGASLRSTFGGPSFVGLNTQTVQLTSTGPGDGVVRVKANLFSRAKRSQSGAPASGPQSRRFKMALAADFRLPTGDEFDYHGTGAFGVKPFLIGSMTNSIISPHINAGFQWNGESYLASQYPNQKRHLPGQIFYTAGFDAAVSSKVTMSFDFLDQTIISGQRTLLRPYVSGEGISYSEIYFDDITRNEYNASAGFKAQIIPRVVVTANVLLRLNEAGLRARVIPLAGISYLF